MTIAPSRPGIVDVITDISKSDPGTADLVTEMLIYDALCEEIDRVRPSLDRNATKIIEKRAEGALEALAKRWNDADEADKADLAETADGLAWLIEVSKTTPTEQEAPPTREKDWWEQEPRDARGRWTGGVVNALRLFAGHKDQHGKEAATAARGHMEAIASGNKYDRARALGNTLNWVGNKTGDAPVSAAGHLTRLVGELGPEAETVFGRGMRRLAYRYRGTERRPEPQFRAQVQAVLNGRLSHAQEQAAASGQSGAKVNRLPDQERLDIVANAGIQHLWRSVPNQKLAELSLASGKLPPSEGIIFDAEGNPVVQAVGYNGDHYLPFDLKNLKRLHGGSYVRTRTTGGLTDEDIYTGLMTGARRVTVVSNSGVFSLEFDPQLRGGRRYNDKARQMVGRYADLLASIKDKKAPLAQDLSPADRAKLRQAAYEKANEDPALAKEYYAEAEAEEKLRRQFNFKDDEELMAEALVSARQQLKEQQDRREVKGTSARTIGQLQREKFNELKAKQRANSVREYRLDGEGYTAAQQALRQEFPYYIRQTYSETLPDFAGRTKGLLKENEALAPRPGKDIGYTRRNMLGPKDHGSTSTSAEAPAAEEAEGSEGSEGTTERPRGFGAARQEAEASAESAASWDDLLAGRDSALYDRLSSALGKTLKAREHTVGLTPPPETGNNDDNAFQLDWDQWSAWALAEKGGASGVAKWLLTPGVNHRHIEMAIESINQLRNSDALTDKGAITPAVELLTQVQMAHEPFATPATGADPVLAVPNRDRPAPQPFDDIAGLGPDLAKLTRYAEKNKDVAEAAQEALNNESSYVDDLREEAERMAALNRWPVGPNGKPKKDHRPPADVDITFEQADQWHRLSAQGRRNHFPDYQDLEEAQKGWALARALQLAALKEDAEVPHVGPKEEVAHRAPLPRRVPLRAPLAKRQPTTSTAGFSSRMNFQPADPNGVWKSEQSPQQSPISPLALELGKRLADDPEYLHRWLGHEL